MDSLNKKLIDEYISKRCEDILLYDAEYQQYNNEILELENRLKRTLNPEQRIVYDTLEETLLKSISYLAICVYKTCIADKNEGFIS